jgi:hypothetical protein
LLFVAISAILYWYSDDYFRVELILDVLLFTFTFSMFKWAQNSARGDPGYVPNDSRARQVAEELGMGACKKCDTILKTPLVHHCKKCDKCVFLMDHHCMFTNQCVGYGTIKHFYLFVFYLALAIANIVFFHARHLYAMTYSPENAVLERLFLIYDMLCATRGKISWSVLPMWLFAFHMFLAASYVMFAFQTAAFMAFNFLSNSSMTE